MAPATPGSLDQPCGAQHEEREREQGAQPEDDGGHRRGPHRPGSHTQSRQDAAGSAPEEADARGQDPAPAQAPVAGRAAREGHERGDPGRPEGRPHRSHERDQRAEQEACGGCGPGDGEVACVQAVHEPAADDEDCCGRSADGSECGADEARQQGAAQDRGHDLATAGTDAAQEPRLTGLVRDEGGEGRGDDDRGDDGAHGGEQGQDRLCHRASRHRRGAHRDDLVGRVEARTGLKGVDHVGDLAHEARGARPGLRSDVEDGRGGRQGEGAVLVRGDEDEGRRAAPAADIGPWLQDADDGDVGRGAVGGAGGEADRVPRAEVPAGGQLRGDRHLACPSWQAAGGEPRASTELRQGQDKGVRVEGAPRAVEPRHRLGVRSRGRDAVEPVHLLGSLHREEPVRRGVPGGGQDHDVGVTDRGARVGLDLSPEGVGDEQ